MTDFTHHTPRLLSDADAAADLAGVPRPNDLPSVGTEDARALGGKPAIEQQAHAWSEMVDLLAMYKPDMMAQEGTGLECAQQALSTLVSERDELVSRVRELESEVLDQCRLNGMGAERELALMNQVTELTRACTEARRWIGDGECSDGLPREYWTGDHSAAIELVDAALSAANHKEHP